MCTDSYFFYVLDLTTFSESYVRMMEMKRSANMLLEVVKQARST